MSLIRLTNKSACNSASNKDLRNSSKNLLEIKLINFLKRGILFLKEKKLVKFMERAYFFLTTREKDTNKYLSYHIFDKGLDMKSFNKINDWLKRSISGRYNRNYYENYIIENNIDFNFPVVGFIDPNIHTGVLSNIETINMILTENCRVDKKIRNSYKYIISKNVSEDHDTFNKLVIPIYNIFGEFIPRSQHYKHRCATDYSLDKSKFKNSFHGIEFSKDDIYMSGNIDILCYPKGGKINPHRDDVSKKSNKYFAKKGLMCFSMILCINSKSTDLANNGTVIWNSIKKGLTFDPHYFTSGVTGYGVLMKSDCLHSEAKNVYEDNIFKIKVDFYINPAIFIIGKHLSYIAGLDDYDDIKYNARELCTGVNTCGEDIKYEYFLGFRINVYNKSDDKLTSIVSNRLNYSNCRCVLCCRNHNSFNVLNMRVKTRNPNYINILCRIQTIYCEDVCFRILEFLDYEYGPIPCRSDYTWGCDGQSESYSRRRNLQYVSCSDNRVCYCNRHISESNNNTLIKHYSDREIYDCNCNCQKCLMECKSWKVSFHNEATQSKNFLRDEIRYITNVYEQTIMSLSSNDFLQDMVYNDPSIRNSLKYDLKTLSHKILNLINKIDDGAKFYKKRKW